MDVKKVLICLTVIISVIIGIELMGLNFLSNQKTRNTTLAALLRGKNCSIVVTPTLILTHNNDQSYRLTDAPDRLTRFLNTAFMGFLSELTDYNPTKSVTIKADSLYEGKVETIYQGKEAEKIHRPDPRFPERTVVSIINLTNIEGENSAKRTISILLVGSEIPLLTIQNESGKKLSLSDVKNKNVRINRIIELPVKKNSDIVTLNPIVYTNILVLEK